MHSPHKLTCLPPSRRSPAAFFSLLKAPYGALDTTATANDLMYAFVPIGAAARRCSCSRRTHTHICTHTHTHLSQSDQEQQGTRQTGVVGEKGKE